VQDIVKPLFIPTQNTGVTFWRMYNYVHAAIRNKTMPAHIVWWNKEVNDTHPWQIDVTNPEYKARILNEMHACARIANVVIMGAIQTEAAFIVQQGLREMYGIPVVTELDDNFISVPTYNPASGWYDPGAKMRSRIIKQIRESDAIIVSTPYLKQIYSEFNSNIYVIPNCIDIGRWGKVQRKPHKGRIVIGWAGGANHIEDLKIIGPVINRITEKFKDVYFTFLHGGLPSFESLNHVKLVKKFARIDQYPEYIAQNGFDIGIAPLVDNAFNRGKSNLRWLEYSALGIPTVASDVGNFKETLKHGETGLLCYDSEDFYNSISMLIQSKELRTRIGKQARADVFENFNVDTVTKKYEKVLQEIIDRGQVKKTMPDYKSSNYKPEAEVIS
jgi:glycosyltransferase involved in cell wall biosynthesis